MAASDFWPTCNQHVAALLAIAVPVLWPTSSGAAGKAELCSPSTGLC